MLYNRIIIRKNASLHVDQDGLPLDFSSCVQMCISSCTSLGETSVRDHESCHGARSGVEDPLSTLSEFCLALLAEASLLLKTLEKKGMLMMSLLVRVTCSYTLYEIRVQIDLLPWKRVSVR